MTEDEARQYYDAHLTEFTTPPTVTLREILVAVAGRRHDASTSAADEAAQGEGRRRSASARRGGESFEKLAAELSDAPSKANGGLIGPLNLDDLSPELRKLIEAMKVGDVTRARSAPRAGIRSSSSSRRRRPQTLPFEQAREQISERVFTDKRQARVREVPREAARAGDHRVEERRTSRRRTTTGWPSSKAAAQPPRQPAPR